MFHDLRPTAKSPLLATAPKHPRSIEAASGRGPIAVVGIMDRPTTTISIPNVMIKNLRLQGVSHGSRADMEESLTFVEKHRIPPIIDARYTFDALPDASIAVSLARSSWKSIEWITCHLQGEWQAIHIL